MVEAHLLFILKNAQELTSNMQNDPIHHVSNAKPEHMDALITWINCNRKENQLKKKDIYRKEEKLKQKTLPTWDKWDCVFLPWDNSDVGLHRGGDNALEDRYIASHGFLVLHTDCIWFP